MSNARTTAALAAAERCAREMLANAGYIRKELPGVTMSAGIRERVASVCGDLVEAGNGLASDIAKIAPGIGTPGGGDRAAERLRNRVEEIMPLLTRLHETVVALDKASRKDVNAGFGYVLVSESATNVLKAYVEMRDSLDRLQPRPQP